MSLRVVELRDPDGAHARANEFLIAVPTVHNVLLTVLGQSRELALTEAAVIARRMAEKVLGRKIG